VKVRTFLASSMSAALARVRAELGDDAVILGSTETASGVEITAAIEPGAGTAEAAPDDGLGGDAEFLLQSMAFHGAPLHLNEAICRSAAELDRGDLLTSLTAGLDRSFRFQPLSAQSIRSVALVGPPGAGKTVIAAKLALEAALASVPLKIATTDIERPGGENRLTELARIIENPPVRLNPERRLDHSGARLIDTEGVNPFSAYDMARLTETIRINDAEPILVLPAGGDPYEYEDIAHAFVDVGVTQLIVTRLDTARRLGGLLAAGSAGLSFAGAGASPVIADGIHNLGPVALARLLLSDPDSQSALEQHRRSA